MDHFAGLVTVRVSDQRSPSRRIASQLHIKLEACVSEHRSVCAANCLSALGSRLESSLANSSGSKGNGGYDIGRFRRASLNRLHKRHRNGICYPHS
jgi:hypothetical protein